MYSVLAWQINILHSINTIMSVSISRTLDRLDSMNDKIRSRWLYLPIVNIFDSGGDADGDDDGSRWRSSISNGGMFPLTIPRDWRRWRRFATTAFERQTVVEDLGSHVKSVSQKPYSFSLNAEKIRVLEICSPGCRCTRSYNDDATTRRGKKTLARLDDFWRGG